MTLRAGFILLILISCSIRCSFTTKNSSEREDTPVSFLTSEFHGYIQRFIYVKNFGEHKNKILLVLQSLPDRILHIFFTLDSGVTYQELQVDYSNKSSTSNPATDGQSFRLKVQKLADDASKSIYLIGHTPGILSFVTLYPAAIHISVDWKNWEDPIDLSGIVKDDRVYALLIHPNNTGVVAILVASDIELRSEKPKKSKLYVRNVKISSSFVYVATVEHQVSWIENDSPKLIYHNIENVKNSSLCIYDAISQTSNVILSNLTMFRQINKQFLAVVRDPSNSNESTYLLSETGKTFQKLYFPHFVKPIIVEYFFHDAMDSVYVIVSNKTFDTKSSGLFLYVAPKQQLGMRKLLSDVHYVEGNCPSVENHPVLPGIMVASVKNSNPLIGYTSLVTLNGGLTWNPMVLTSESCIPPSCIFRINHCDDGRQWLISNNAPWLVVTMADLIKSNQGSSVTESKHNLQMITSKMYISRDAGYSWTLIFPNLAHFTIIDHGGVIVVAPIYTQEILYSVDEGRSWKAVIFSHKIIYSVSFMDVSDDFSTKYAMLIVKTVEVHKLSVTIYRFDFSKLFKSICSLHSHFYKWSPLRYENDHNNHFTPCFRGEKYSFLRRKNGILCYIPSEDEPSGKEYLQKCIEKSSCHCLNTDFQCRYGYEYKNKSCQPDPDFFINETCQAGTLYSPTHREYGFNYGQCSGVLAHSDLENNTFSIKHLAKIQPYKVTSICELNEFSSGVGYVTAEFGLVYFGLISGAWKNSVNFSNVSFYLPALSSMENYVFDLHRKCIYGSRDVNLFLFCYSELDVFGILTEISWKQLSFMDKNEKIINIEFDAYGDNLLVATKDGVSAIRLLTGFTFTLWETSEELLKVLFYPLDGLILCEYRERNTSSIFLELLAINGSRIFKSQFSKKFTNLQFDPLSAKIYFLDESVPTNPTISSMKLTNQNKSTITNFESKVVLKCVATTCKHFTLSKRKSKEENLYIITTTSDSLNIYKVDNQNIYLQGSRHAMKNGVHFMDSLTRSGMIFDSRDWILSTSCRTDSKCKNFCFRDFSSSSSRPTCYCEQPTSNRSELCKKLSKVCNSKTQFECHIQRECISKHGVCNLRPDCADSTDERNCTNEEWKIICEPDQRKCLNENLCVDEGSWCDGKYDCIDGSDESICPGKKANCLDEFDCLDGKCIAMKQVCDQKKDCETHLDEMFCDQNSQNGSCKVGEFRCSDSKCISSQKMCDGFKDCASGEDEEHCVKDEECLMRCFSGKCITSAQYCDRVMDCEFGEDELSCPIDDIMHTLRTQIIAIVVFGIVCFILFNHKHIRRFFSWFISHYRIKRFYRSTSYSDLMGSDSDMDPLIDYQADIPMDDTYTGREAARKDHRNQSSLLDDEEVV